MGEKVSIHSSSSKASSDKIFRSVYKTQLEELAEVSYPSLAAEERIKHMALLREKFPPVYVYFPWKNVELEMLPEAAFMRLKTNRNQLLITAEEQEQLLDAQICIAGMSVGSSLLYGLVGSGIARRLTIADHDRFSTSNLNRVQATVLDIEEHKVTVAARRALEMNPFLQIRTISQPLTLDNLDSFLYDNGQTIIFEEIDDFRMKVEIRETARLRRLPLVMLTNLGDNVLIDVERYDLTPDQALFNGYVDEKLLERIKHEVINQEMMKELAISLVDRSLVPERAVQSLAEIGHTLTGRPQLYGTVALDGGIAPYLVRQIILNDNLPSGRYAFRLDKLVIRPDGVV